MDRVTTQSKQDREHKESAAKQTADYYKTAEHKKANVNREAYVIPDTAPAIKTGTSQNIPNTKALTYEQPLYSNNTTGDRKSAESSSYGQQKQTGYHPTETAKQNNSSSTQKPDLHYEQPFSSSHYEQPLPASHTPTQTPGNVTTKSEQTSERMSSVTSQTADYYKTVEHTQAHVNREAYVVPEKTPEVKTTVTPNIQTGDTTPGYREVQKPVNERNYTSEARPVSPQSVPRGNVATQSEQANSRVSSVTSQTSDYYKTVEHTQAHVNREAYVVPEKPPEVKTTVTPNIQTGNATPGYREVQKPVNERNYASEARPVSPQSVPRGNVTTQSEQTSERMSSVTSQTSDYYKTVEHTQAHVNREVYVVPEKVPDIRTTSEQNIQTQNHERAATSVQGSVPRGDYQKFTSAPVNKVTTGSQISKAQASKVEEQSNNYHKTVEPTSANIIRQAYVIPAAVPVLKTAASQRVQADFSSSGTLSKIMTGSSLANSRAANVVKQTSDYQKKAEPVKNQVNRNAYVIPQAAPRIKTATFNSVVNKNEIQQSSYRWTYGKKSDFANGRKINHALKAEVNHYAYTIPKKVPQLKTGGAVSTPVNTNGGLLKGLSSAAEGLTKATKSLVQGNDLGSQVMVTGISSAEMGVRTVIATPKAVKTSTKAIVSTVDKAGTTIKRAADGTYKVATAAGTVTIAIAQTAKTVKAAKTANVSISGIRELNHRLNISQKINHAVKNTPRNIKTFTGKTGRRIWTGTKSGVKRTGRVGRRGLKSGTRKAVDQLANSEDENVAGMANVVRTSVGGVQTAVGGVRTAKSIGKGVIHTGKNIKNTYNKAKNGAKAAKETAKTLNRTAKWAKEAMQQAAMKAGQAAVKAAQAAGRVVAQIISAVGQALAWLAALLGPVGIIIAAAGAVVAFIVAIFSGWFSVGTADTGYTDYEIADYIEQYVPALLAELEDDLLEDMEDDVDDYDIVRLYSTMGSEEVIDWQNDGLTTAFPTVQEIVDTLTPLYNAIVLMDYDLSPTEDEAEQLIEDLFDRLFTITNEESLEYCGQDLLTGEGEIAYCDSCGEVHALDNCPNPTEELEHTEYTCDICDYKYCPGHALSYTTCGLTEHSHNSSCYTWYLNCELTHVHNSSCYDSYLDCGLEEHEHSAWVSADNPGCYSTYYCAGCVFVCNGYVNCNGHEVIAYTVNSDGIYGLVAEYFTDPINDLSNITNPTDEQSQELADLKSYYEIFEIMMEMYESTYSSGLSADDVSNVEFTNDGTRTGNEDVVNLAISQVGQTGGEPYWSYYGFSSRVEWCACFVNWCMRNSSASSSYPTTSNNAYCQTIANYFMSIGQWGSPGYTNLVAGDTIFFDWNGDGHTDHIGIVIGTDGTTVYTVEGNSGDAVKLRSYSITSSVIYGYGLMNY